MSHSLTDMKYISNIIKYIYNRKCIFQLHLPPHILKTETSRNISFCNLYTITEETLNQYKYAF